MASKKDKSIDNLQAMAETSSSNEDDASKETSSISSDEQQAAVNTKAADGPAKKKLSASEELRTQICKNKFCQCIRRDGKMNRLEDLILHRLLKQRKRLEQEQLEREARSFLASLDTKPGGESLVTVVSPPKEGDARPKFKVIQQSQAAKGDKVVQPTPKALAAAAAAQLSPPSAGYCLPSKPSRPQVPSLLQRHGEIARLRMATAAAAAQQKSRSIATCVSLKTPPAHSSPEALRIHDPTTLLDHKVWQTSGSFSRKTRRIESTWDYPDSLHHQRQQQSEKVDLTGTVRLPPNKRLKQNTTTTTTAAWNVPQTIQTKQQKQEQQQPQEQHGSDAFRRTSESDMTTTSELTLQSEVMAMAANRPSPVMHGYNNNNSSEDDHQTHIISLGTTTGGPTRTSAAAAATTTTGSVHSVRFFSHMPPMKPVAASR